MTKNNLCLNFKISNKDFLIKQIKNLDINKIFYAGVFLLPSAPYISSVLLIISGIYASIKRKNSYFSDKWNLPFLIMGILMILNSFLITSNIVQIDLEILNSKLIWIGLINWIPYFWSFWAFQYFTFHPDQRKKIGLVLLSGTVPVIISGILQFFFKINGPFIFLNGLITWYSKPIDGYNGLSGLFSNANYTGSWLNLVLPFSLAFLIEAKEKKSHSIIALSFFILIVISTILTYSRNSILGLFLALILIMGIKTLKWIIPSLITIGIPISLSIGLIKSKTIIEISRKFIPEIIWNYRFIDFGFDNFFEYGRIKIWTYALKLIGMNPLWGWGSASFPILYNIETDLYKGHAHNLLLEIGVNYGTISSILFLSTIVLITFYSITQNIDQITTLYDQAWRTSFLLVFTNQMFDIQYFDFRIGFAFWLLLGGLRNFIK